MVLHCFGVGAHPKPVFYCVRHLATFRAHVINVCIGLAGISLKKPVVTCSQTDDKDGVVPRGDGVTVSRP